MQQIIVDEAMVRVYRVQHDFLIHIFLCCVLRLHPGLCGGTRKCHMLSDIGTLKAWDSKGLCPVLSFHHTTDRNNTSIPMAAAF